MRIDGLQISEGGSVSNLLTPTGTSFPNQPNTGELFYFTGVTGDGPGLYAYDGSDWIIQGGGSVNLDLAGLNNVIIKNVDGNYTIIEPDASNTLIRVNSPFGVTSTVTVIDTPTTPIGSVFYVSSSGSGPVQVQGSEGVLVSSPQSLIIERKFGRITLVKTQSNRWEVDGQLRAQEQILINPIHPQYSPLFMLYEQFQDIPQNEVIQNSMYIQNDGRQLGFWSNPLNSYGNTTMYSHWVSGDQTYLFANVTAQNMYFRARVTGGTATLIQQNGNPATYQRKYLAENEWGQFKVPVADDNWAAFYLNPFWNWQETRENTLPVTLTFDVAELPSDASIIGSFSFTYHPLLTNWWDDAFPVSGEYKDFTVSPYGTVLGTTYADVQEQASSLVSHPEYQITFGGNGIYYRVTSVSGSNAGDPPNGNTGQLDAYYSPDDMQNFRFNVNPDLLIGQSTIYNLQLHSDASGTIQQIAQSNIELIKAAMPLTMDENLVSFYPMLFVLTTDILDTTTFDYSINLITNGKNIDMQVTSNHASLSGFSKYSIDPYPEIGIPSGSRAYASSGDPTSNYQFMLQSTDLRWGPSETTDRTWLGLDTFGNWSDTPGSEPAWKIVKPVTDANLFGGSFLNNHLKIYKNPTEWGKTITLNDPIITTVQPSAGYMLGVTTFELMPYGEINVKGKVGGPDELVDYSSQIIFNGGYYTLSTPIPGIVLSVSTTVNAIDYTNNFTFNQQMTFDDIANLPDGRLKFEVLNGVQNGQFVISVFDPNDLINPLAEYTYNISDIAA